MEKSEELTLAEAKLEALKYQMRITALETAKSISILDSVSSKELVERASEILTFLQGESK